MSTRDGEDLKLVKSCIITSPGRTAEANYT